MSWWSNLGPHPYRVVTQKVNLDVAPAVNQGTAAPVNPGVVTSAPQGTAAPVKHGVISPRAHGEVAALAQGVGTPEAQGVVVPVAQGVITPVAQGVVTPVVQEGAAPGEPAGLEQAAVPQPERSAGAPTGPEIKSYVIRLACVNDCSTIAKLELASAQFERRLAPINFTFAELRALWRKRINSGEFYVLVAEGQVTGAPGKVAADKLAPVRSQMLGFVGLKAPLGQDGFIQAIYIAPPFYRLGLGGALLSAAEKILRQRGCRRVVLYVEPFNRMGQCFYRKAGFYATQQKYRHLDILVKEL